MRAADYKVYEADPFDAEAPFAVNTRERSPYVNRIRLMWQEMRAQIGGKLPEPKGITGGTKRYLEHVDDVYVTDAYHSLSIEGYRVSHELIERVRSGIWNPDNNDQDRERRDALAARGYWEAFQAVRDSVRKVLDRDNPGAVAEADTVG